MSKLTKLSRCGFTYYQHSQVRNNSVKRRAQVLSSINKSIWPPVFRSLSVAGVAQLWVRSVSYISSEERMKTHLTGNGTSVLEVTAHQVN